MRILLVDDQEDIRTIGRMSLESVGGFETSVAAGPFEALAAVKAQRPDLILMDVMMPGMDGVAILRELKGTPEFCDIPVVFLTAKVRRGEIDDYRRLGAAGVIHKPFDPITLPDQIRRMLSTSAPQSPFPKDTAPETRHGVLEAEAEDALESLLRVASAVANTPFACVTLLFPEPHRIVASVGLPRQEASRELPLCLESLLSSGLLELEDVTTDVRLARDALVTGEAAVRFFAGLPLVDANAGVLGSLCVLDRVPRRLSESEKRALRELGSGVVRLLQGRRSEVARRAGELAVERGVSQFVLAVEACPTGMLLVDGQGTIILTNGSFNRLLGYESDEVLGKPASSVLPGSVAALLVAGNARHAGASEYRVHRKDGSELAVEIGASPIETASGRRVLGAFTDLSQRKEVEAIREQLARQERLVTTGTLAAGIGHEINNPLTYILGNAEFALEELLAIAGASPSARMRDMLDLVGGIRDGAERIRKIVRGLRAFARADTVCMPIDVHASLEVAINMAVHELRQRATVITDLGSVPLVLADEAGLSQVLVNLLVNAGQAFQSNDPASNEIRIRTSMAPDQQVAIEVSDNGPGIPPLVLPRIFDPFFTTKPVGKGTGLGLAICHNVIDGFGGSLTCETEVGKGTTFRVLLPQAADAAEAVLSPARIVSGPRGRVLFVDDEAAIAQLAVRLLQADHDVVVARDARKRLLVEREDYDVIFCDLMMPYLTGMELYRETIRTRPELGTRFVFMTGGAAHVETQEFLVGVSNERLDKPFEAQKLREIAQRFRARRASSPEVTAGAIVHRTLDRGILE